LTCLMTALTTCVNEYDRPHLSLPPRVCVRTLSHTMNTHHITSMPSLSLSRPLYLYTLSHAPSQPTHLPCIAAILLLPLLACMGSLWSTSCADKTKTPGRHVTLTHTNHQTTGTHQHGSMDGYGICTGRGGGEGGREGHADKDKKTRRGK